MPPIRAAITALGRYVPERVVTNADLEKIVDTTDEWIRTRTGIRQRHVRRAGHAHQRAGRAGRAQDLPASGAASAAGEVDLIIVATVTPDMLFPATACLVQDKLGATRAWGFDLSRPPARASSTRSPWAPSSSQAGTHRKVLVIGADVMTVILNYRTAPPACCSATGPGAVLLEPADDDDRPPRLRQRDRRLGRLLPLHAGRRQPAPGHARDGGQEAALHPPGGPARLQVRGAQDGRASACPCSTSNGVLRSENVDLFVPHQANVRIIDAAQHRLGLPDEKVVKNIDRYGNTTAATIPLALGTALDERRLKRRRPGGAGRRGRRLHRGRGAPALVGRALERRPVRRWAAAAGALAGALTAEAARPCAPAPPPGRHVSILAEQALIVWDPAARRQHFVRRARFTSDAADFGFLVPTPSAPQLAEAPDSVFDALHHAIQPAVVTRTGLRLLPFSVLMAPFLLTRGAPEGAPAGGPLTAAAPPQVRVLQEQRVAGYDAAVLQAEDAGALLRWLKAHGYDARPELLAWVGPYVEQRWTLTAFKVAGGAPGSVATQAVRMSFDTERPFFPYREPAAAAAAASPGPARELLVYLVAPRRMEGAIGSGAAWTAAVPYSAPGRGLAAALAPVLPEGTAPAATWLTTFVDRASPRPGTDDLFFSDASTQETIVPEPIVRDERTPVPIPVDLALGMAAGGWWWGRRRRRRAR